MARNDVYEVTQKALFDENLSAGAKGLLIYLLNLPENEYKGQTELLNHFSNKRDSMNRFIRELEKFNYIFRKNTSDVSNKYKGTEFYILNKDASKTIKVLSPKNHNTRNGYTYIIKDELADVVKIGFSRDVKKRLSQIRVSNIHANLLDSIDGDYEEFLHTALSERHVIGDWYDVTLDEIKFILRGCK